jgi:hypothetical protein
MTHGRYEATAPVRVPSIGCDFHPSFQQIAIVDTETGEQEEKRLTRLKQFCSMANRKVRK